MTETKPPHDGGRAAWAEHWRRLGPKLDAIRRDELRRFDYRSQLPMIDGLLEIGFRFHKPQKLSGLIEWSRRLREHYAAQGRLQPTNTERPGPGGARTLHVSRREEDR